MKKETLIREYIENKLNQNEIAEKYNISQQTVSRYFKKYDIECRPKHSLPDEILTELEEQFIFGKLLGDGSVYKGQKSVNCRLGFAHGIKQKEYCEYCYEFIKRWCKNPPVYREQKRNPKIYSTPILKKYVLESISHPEFSRLRRYFYEHGTKIVNNDILSNITPLGLAIWYQDDGSLEIDRRTNNINGMKLHTLQFSYTCVKNICSWLEKTYNIYSNPNKSQKSKNGDMMYCIRISKRSIKDFSDLIRPYVHSSMTYKIV